MKKIFLTVMVLVMLLGSVVIVALAETKYYKQPEEAIVVSTSVSIRAKTDEESDRLAKMSNGDWVKIIGENGSWYIIDLSYNYPDWNGGYGYALKQYFVLNPYWITLTADETYLWADPWGTGISNGSKTKGSKMLVLMETNEWYVVQTRDDSAGSSFIRKSDVYQNGNTSNGISVQQNGAGTYMVKCDTLGVYPYPDDNVERVDFIHYGDLVTVLTVGDYFTKIKHEINGISCECYVHSEHLIKVAE